MTMMEIDRLLRQSGAGWRERYSTPLAIPQFEETTMPASRSTSRFLAPLASAAVIVVIAVIVAIVSRSSHSSTAGGPGGTSSTNPTAHPTASASATRSSGPAAGNCTGAQMSATVGLAGPANGTENIFILLRNTSQHACRLGGLLPLSGVRADGTIVKLPFAGSTNPAYADPGPVTGPGPVDPGKYGAFHVTVGLNCAPPSGKYVTLRIGLGAGEHVDMAYPSQFSLGCLGYEAPAGPISSPDALAGH
jgi:hypothetical protein